MQSLTMVKLPVFFVLSYCFGKAIARPSFDAIQASFYAGAKALTHGKADTVVVPAPPSPTTPPRPIGESDKKKQCPPGFEFQGKQCAKTLTAPPQVTCPAGTTMVDGKCVKYVGKFSECPVGFKSSKGICIKETFSSAEYDCPEGFILTGKNTCSRKRTLPDKKICPVGSVQRGDNCVVISMGPTQLTCPEQYILQGTKCRREETFDCTPERQPEAPQKNIVEESKASHVQRQIHGKEILRYTLPQAAPTVEEYVISEICKRVTTEPARHICGPNSILDGKVCRVETNVDYMVKTGGLVDEFAPIQQHCPQGFVQTEKPDVCKATTEMTPELRCPHHTVDLGSRCGIYSNTRTHCPQGFSLEGDTCIKITFAAPIVEYTVTYECTGKNCEHSAVQPQNPMHLRH
jgi:hypothetical protein